MASFQSSDAHRPYYAAEIPAPVIPMRRTPWFMKALWLLALLMVVGLVYSFWRLSSVPSPTLDVPPTSIESAPSK